MEITKIIKTNDYIIMFDKNSGLEIISGTDGKKDPFVLQHPNMIDIGIMGHCKNNCEICYQGNINIPNMTIDDFKTIIDQTKNHINQVALGGKGDPNKHENFKEIIEYCVKNNVVANYTTSGNDLTEEEIEISKLCGAVAVSMYNKDYTYAALNNLIESNIKTNIHFILSKDTFDEVMQILESKDIWQGRFPIEKINAVIFLLFKPQGNGKDKKHLCLNLNQIKKFSDKILNIESKFKIGFDSCTVNKICQSRRLTEKESIFSDTCEASRMSCYISPDMYFIPCSFGDKEKYGIKIDDVNTIQKIWNSGYSFLNFRKILKENPSCCPYQL
jgi:hypothetical protein